MSTYYLLFIFSLLSMGFILKIVIALSFLKRARGTGIALLGSAAVTGGFSVMVAQWIAETVCK